MWKLLYVNDSILSTTLVGGNHGHMWIVTQDTLYVTISSSPYDTPFGPRRNNNSPHKVLRQFACNYYMSNGKPVAYMVIKKTWMQN